MRSNRMVFLSVFTCLLTGACNKEAADPEKLIGALPARGEQATAREQTAADEAEEPADLGSALAARIGIRPGGFTVDEATGAEAVMVAHEGAVGIRRVGEETFSAAPSTGAVELYAGDQIQTGDDARATLMLADGSTAELAEQSVVAIADRDADADPASSIAVLVGVVRFEITGRAEGEGPFLVFVPAGVVNALGTTFAVGVAATGDARVGVEEGTVEVAGSSDLTHTASLTADKAVALSAGGELAAVAKLDAQWGTWRADLEAAVEPTAALDAHVKAAKAAEVQIEAGFDVLQDLTVKAAQVDADAESMKEKSDLVGYEASAEARVGAIEAPFLVSLRLEQLTFAMLAHAQVAQELYLRHPQALATIYLPNADLSARAILHHKKFHAACKAHVKPLRAAYYRHHPRGRGYAKAAGAEVPEFFRKAKVAAGKNAAHPKLDAIAVYRPRRPAKLDKKRHLEPNGPAHGWHAKRELKAKPAGWYNVAPDARAALLLRGKPKRAPERVFRAHAPEPRERVTLAWGKPDKGHPGLHLGRGNRGDLSKPRAQAQEAKTVEKTADGKPEHDGPGARSTAAAHDEDGEHDEHEKAKPERAHPARGKAERKRAKN